MTVSIPKTQELADDIVAKIEVETEQDVPLLQKAFTRILAKVLAGGQIILYKYCGFLSLQMLVRYATMDETVINGRRIRPLLELGRQIGEPDPVQAVPAELKVRVTVRTQTGALPASSQLLYAPTGVLYITLRAVPLNAATVDVDVIPIADPSGGDGSGAIGNRAPGDVLSFANPLGNVATDAVVVSQTVAGSDGESVEAYRARVLRRSQRKPQGGALADYQKWAEGVPGILNGYPYRSTLPGEVNVFVEATVESSGSADGIPTGGQLTAVSDAIQLDEDGLASNRPVGAFVVVLPITRRAFDVQVNGLVADDLSAAQDAIQQAAEEFFASREPFIVGLSVLPRADRVTQSAIAGVVTEAADALGASVTTVALSIGGIPYTGFTLGQGEKAKLGTITF